MLIDKLRFKGEPAQDGKESVCLHSPPEGALGSYFLNVQQWENEPESVQDGESFLIIPKSPGKNASGE